MEGIWSGWDKENKVVREVVERVNRVVGRDRIDVGKSDAKTTGSRPVVTKRVALSPEHLDQARYAIFHVGPAIEIDENVFEGPERSAEILRLAAIPHQVLA